MGTRRQEVIEDCRYELSINFQKPAVAILMFHGARIGLTYEEMGRLVDGECLTNTNLCCGLPTPPWPNPRPQPKEPEPHPKRAG